MRSFYIFLLFFSVSAFASVTDVQLKEKHRDWHVYTALEDGEKICYMVSYPKKEGETDRKPYITVSYIDDKIDEVSVTSGFQYDREPITLHIDRKIKYMLPIIDGGFAWAEDTKTDRDLVLRMKGGLSMVVSGKKKGTTINDTYSLLGFQNAYKKMHELCKKTDEKVVNKK
ncbi:MAG: invasion associated locus B family protein [Wolbachia endosymbiont of Tyrophagus putrescentiae]|nr:invasion associated locus B family protein [Wolbachia endosymbiont of Tyrophagus putrescentiae]